LVYDCLYPYTVGGAERWYRNLAERLAASGHDVTFLTRRQWARDSDVDVPGVRVIAVSPRTALYARGRRRILPPVFFGLGVLRHLLRHGRRYDIVHTASFPYFSLLAAGALQRRRGYRLFVDWHEVWTQAYWEEYLGRVGGWIGWRVQRACVRLERLRAFGLTGRLTRLEGQYAGRPAANEATEAQPLVVFAGRHIPEKRVPALVPALARLPGLRGEIFGDGPERPKVLDEIARHRLEERVQAPGFVDEAVLEQALASAVCFALPSEREGYGLVIVESAARGVPSVAVQGPDNAATELIEDGTNGAIAASANADDLADAISRVRDSGQQLRASTLEWFRRNADRLSLESSVQVVVREYSSADS
jgi:glycosyltransferase involved in cell wall biosynthesis